MMISRRSNSPGASSPNRPMRVVIATLGSVGDLFPYLSLAAGLRRNGHTVTVATRTAYRHHVESAGLTWHRMRPEWPETPELYAKMMAPATGTIHVYKHLVAPAVRDSYADLRDAAADCDLLVSTPLSFAGTLALREAGPALGFGAPPADRLFTHR